AEPELLANHCAAAGLGDKAAAYWRKAAQQAIERSATAEAVAHLERGLELLAAFPDGQAATALHADFQLAPGGQISAAKVPAAPETGAVSARASELSRQAGKAPALFAALYGLGGFHFCRAELQMSRAISDEMLHLAESRGSTAEQMTAHRLLAADLFMLSE